MSSSRSSSSSSSLLGLASPAPVVEPAEVEPQQSYSSVQGVEPVPPDDGDDDDVLHHVEAPAPVDPATTEASTMAELLPLQAITPSHAAELSVMKLKSRVGGLQFSSKAAVIKGGVNKHWLRRLLSSCYDERDFVSFGEVRRYVYVHGNIIFVYVDDDETLKPLYAITISNTLLVEVEDPARPDPHSYTISPRPNTNQTGESFVTVLLKDKLTLDIRYQVTFDTSKDKSVVKRFIDVITENTKHYGGHVLEASIVHADSDYDYHTTKDEAVKTKMTTMTMTKTKTTMSKNIKK